MRRTRSSAVPPSPRELRGQVLTCHIQSHYESRGSGFSSCLYTCLFSRVAMERSRHRPFRPMIRWGFVGSTIYGVFFLSTLLSSFMKTSWDAQIAAAIFSAPTSAWTLDAMQSSLRMLGLPSSSHRQFLEWLMIYIAGTIQYFGVGFLLGILLSPTDKRGRP